MSKEIQAVYTTGNTIYAVLLNSVGQAWNGSTFETPLTANWSTYSISLTEQSTTGIYEADFPTVAAGLYSATVYKRAGASPVTTDPIVAVGTIPWAGLTVQSVQTGDSFARLGTPAGASISADIQTRSTYAGGAVASVTGDVAGKVLGGGTGTITGTGVRAVDGSGNALGTATGQTAILTDTGALVSRVTTGRAANLDRLDATISGIAATILVTPANKLATNPDGSLPGLIPADQGTAIGGGTTTQFTATSISLSSRPGAYTPKQAVRFDSGVNKGQWRQIQSYTVPSGVPTFVLVDAFTDPPGNGDLFKII